ncbi:MAG: glutamine amidotransferase [Pseudomonadota bacterium]
MRITIIETGLPPEPLRGDWPDYPAMFRALLGAADGDFGYETVSVAKGDALPDPAKLDGVLITGSAAGVYDPEPWMASLMSFIQTAAAARTPQFGICFGHQALAEALGGKVQKSEKGWGVGRHVYTTPHRPDWMRDAPPSFALAVSHQDQVVEQPPETEVTASSDFTPFAGLAYRAAPAASFQGHPEFPAAFGAALHDLRRDRIGDALVDEALASLAQPLDASDIGVAMARFFRQNAG